MNISILGQKYNLRDPDDVSKVGDLIDNAKDRNAYGDLSVIAYALLTAIVCREAA